MQTATIADCIDEVGEIRRSVLEALERSRLYGLDLIAQQRQIEVQVTELGWIIAPRLGLFAIPVAAQCADVPRRQDRATFLCHRGWR